MFHVFWELDQRRKIAEANAAAKHTLSVGAQTQRELEALEERVDRLSLACVALWSLVQEKTKLTEEDFLEKVKQIDLRDDGHAKGNGNGNGNGSGKGKGKKKLAKCAKCHRVMATRHTRCLYCGERKLTLTAAAETAHAEPTAAAASEARPTEKAVST